MKSIAILIHGRHLQTEGWETVVWGEPPNKLGTLPRAVLEILERGIENIGLVVCGTGASEKDGLVEAEYMKQFLLQNMAYLSEFDVIGQHVRFQSNRDLSLLSKCIKGIVCETVSQNTAQEIENAAKLFADANCRHVYHMTLQSHGPRALLEVLKARSRGAIPKWQQWYTVVDDTTYEGTNLEDVVVVEPPHRGDDPMLGAQHQIHEVIPPLFALKENDPVELVKLLETWKKNIG